LVHYIYIGGVILANIKSAKKRILVNEKKAERNKSIKSKVKTMIKKVDTAVATGDKAVAGATLLAAVTEIDKACSKGIYHKNTAARKVSRLTKAVNKLA
jgi:small subunit ribosomal protein S20